jgi:SSS family solute:Na+ symporter
MNVHTNFGAIDWVIVVLYLLGSLAVGVFAHRYVGRLEDYLVAGRAVRPNLGVATMIASELGLVTLMYFAQQGFANGPAALHIAVIWFGGMLGVGLSGFIVYRLRAAGVITIPEYYGQRFSPQVRWLGGLILALSGIVNMGIFLQVDAKFLVAVTGLQDIEVSGWQASTALTWVMIGMMAIVLVYTALGGMVSVVVTDLFQFVVLTGGMLIVTVVVIGRLGWEPIFKAVEVQRGSQAFDPLTNPEYGLGYVVWMAWMSVAAGALWQSATIRALASRSPEVAKKVFAWSSIGFLARAAIPIFWGIAAYVFILSGPEDLRNLFLDEAGGIREARPGVKVDTAYALPIMIGSLVPTALLGVVAAGMLAASMSTYSSYLLCWAGVIAHDLVSPCVPGGLSAAARILITRICVLAIGVYLVVFGLFYYSDNIYNYMAATATIYLSGASAVVTLGLYWPRASSRAAILSLLAGLLGLLVPLRQPLVAQGILPAGTTDATLALVTIAASWAAMIVGSIVLPDRRDGAPGSAIPPSPSGASA